MAQDLGQSCPLCLDTCDPDDMLPVTIGHKHPPALVQIHLCADCLRAVIEAAREQIEASKGESSDDQSHGGFHADISDGLGSVDPAATLDYSAAEVPADDSAAHDAEPVANDTEKVSDDRD